MPSTKVRKFGGFGVRNREKWKVVGKTQYRGEAERAIFSARTHPIRDGRSLDRAEELRW